MEKIMQNKKVIKIICIALATLLWVYVSYQENPSMSKTVKNVPIVIVGEQALKEKGFSVYSVSEKSVNVKATANRLTLSRINSKTVSANINVSSIKKAGTHVVPATITSSVSSAANYYVKTSDIKVIIEPIMKDTFAVEAVLNKPDAENKVIDSYALSDESVSVSAPKSIISDIGNVKTEVITTAPESGTQTVRLVAYAKNGKILEGVEFSPAEITVSYIISDVKKVPVILKTSDGKSHQLPSQYDVDICGFGESFNSLKEIATLPLDVTGAKDGDILTAILDVPGYAKPKDISKEIQIRFESGFFKED